MDEKSFCMHKTTYYKIWFFSFAASEMEKKTVLESFNLL
jgi:hypothetical protein